MSKSARKAEIADLKRGLRPIIEKWYEKMKKEDPGFRKLRPNEINKVVTDAARRIQK